MSSGNASAQNPAEKPKQKWWVWPLVSLISGVAAALLLLTVPYDLDWRAHLYAGLGIGLFVLIFTNPHGRFFRIAQGILGSISLYMSFAFVFEGTYEGQHFLIKTQDIPASVYIALVFCAIVALILDFLWRGGKLNLGPLVTHETSDSSTHNQSENEIHAPVTDSFNPTNNNIGSVGTLNQAKEIHIHPPQTPPEKKSPKFLTPEPPGPPTIFEGREETLVEIRQDLEAHGDLLLLSGLGGIGKTAVARAYWKRYKGQYDRMAWLDCTTTLRGALLAGQLESAFELDIQNLNKKQRIAQLKQAMSNADGQNLLVIDNANEGKELEADPLAFSGWHVLITSRAKGTTLRHKDIGVLAPEYARAAFLRYAEKQGLAETGLDDLLAAAGYHTLLIELLAGLIKRGKYNSVAALYQAVVNQGILKAGGAAHLKVVWHDMTEAALEEIVSKLFDLSNLPPAQRDTLALLSMLPSVFVPISHLNTLFGGSDTQNDLFLNQLHALSNSGWLERGQEGEEMAFKLHFLIQQVVRQREKPSSEAIDALGVRLLEMLRPDRNRPLHVQRPYLVYALEWMHHHKPAITKRTIELPRAMGIFLLGIGDLDGAFQSFRDYHEIATRLWATSLDDDFYRQLSIAEDEIGDIHQAQGRLDAALEAYQQSHAIAQALAERNPTAETLQRDLSISHEKIGDIHQAQGRLDAALEAYQQSLAITQALAERNPTAETLQRDLSVSHNKIGDIHKAQGRLDAALDAYQQALAIAQTLAERNPSAEALQRDLSISHEKIGDIHKAQGRLDAAKERFQQSLKIKASLVQKNPSSMELHWSHFTALQRVARIAFLEGDKAAALAYLQTTLQEAQWVADHRGTPDDLYWLQNTKDRIAALQAGTRPPGW
jgi:tetratricopeptide (TPR) repeat protein